MKYAAIDIGTNSCRLLICERVGDNLLKIDEQLESTRIGEAVAETGNLNPQAIDRTCVCLDKFRRQLDKHEIAHFRAVATSAVRESHNAQEFVDKAFKESGIKVEIVSGEEEAYLSYLGVKEGLNMSAVPLVVDLGGGSCEFILNNNSSFLASIPVGAVRATESKMSALDILEKLSIVTREKERFNNHPIVMVCGTATTMVAVKLALEVYRSDLVHGQVLTRREIADLYNMLERMPLNIRRRLPGLQPERADIIAKGALIVLLIVDSLGKTEITVSESDLLEGIIRSL
jgi:exopolyphosphatase/guanosine-5'-triphosphate,3'-diphosphate pyrophosphatase